jgi:UMF1 family MFS transporter
MSGRQILYFAITLNLTAGLGAFLFALIEDRIGSRTTILISLFGLMVIGVYVLCAQTLQGFWLGGAALGIFVGPAQAASRSYLARMAPEHLRNEMFGLLAFSGKATAFIGPLLVGWITQFTASQRWGMSTILVLFAAGFVLMWPLPEAKAGTIASS